MCTEPTQPLSGEILTYATVTAEDGAHLDISTVQLGFGVVITKKPISMLKYSRKLNRGNMSSVLEKLRWHLLHLWYSQHLVA